MNFDTDMKRFQEDSKNLETNLQHIRDYVGRINQIMMELSSGVKVLIERGALEKTEKRVNNEFMGYYKAIHNLEQYFGALAQNINDYDDKINANQQQRIDSMRIELKALINNQRAEEAKLLEEHQESLQKQQTEFIERLEAVQKRKESEIVDRTVLNNIKHLMESLDCDAEKAMQLMKIPKKSRNKYLNIIKEASKKG